MSTSVKKDLVEVVRCVDCIYNYDNADSDIQRQYADDEPVNTWDILCTYFETDGLTGDDFCSRAKRKDERKQLTKE